MPEIKEVHDSHLSFMGSTCPNCKVGKFEVPPDGHPSYVLCDTCGAIQLTYIPMDYQMEMHQAPYDLNPDGTIKNQTLGMFGGYGSAKSTASLNEFFIRCLENPNGVGIITAPTLQQLKRTSIKMLLDEIIPPPLLEHYNKSEGEMRLANGFVIYTIPSDDEEKLRSINAGLAHMEEASGIKRTIYDQILTRLRNKYTKNKVFIVCSNPDMGWIKDVLVNNIDRANPNHPEHKDYDPTMHVYIWKTSINKYLPMDYVEKQSRGKPEWWVQRFLMGSFNHASGMVYPDIMSCVIDDIPNFEQISKFWEHCASADFGIRNPTVFLRASIDPVAGILIVYDCYYKPDALLPEHAAAIKPKVDSIPAGRLMFMVGDPSMMNRSADVLNGRSVQGLYQEYDLYFTPGNNNLDAGIMRLNSYIKRGRLKIFRSCVDLIREMTNYKYPELSMDDTKNHDEKPIKYNDHAPDALRYMVMRLPENPDQLANLSYSYMDSRVQELEDDDDWEEDNNTRDYRSYV